MKHYRTEGNTADWNQDKDKRTCYKRGRGTEERMVREMHGRNMARDF